MITRKEFKCTTEDIDSVVLELAKEIEDGWSIESIHDFTCELSVAIKSYPTFLVTLVNKKYNDMRGMYLRAKML